MSHPVFTLYPNPTNKEKSKMPARNAVAHSAPRQKTASSTSKISSTVDKVVPIGSRGKAAANKAAVARNAEKLAAVKSTADAAKSAVATAVANVKLPSNPDELRRLAIEERAAMRKAKTQGKPVPPTPACDAIENGDVPKASSDARKRSSSDTPRVVEEQTVDFIFNGKLMGPSNNVLRGISRRTGDEKNSAMSSSGFREWLKTHHKISEPNTSEWGPITLPNGKTAQAVLKSRTASVVAELKKQQKSDTSAAAKPADSAQKTTTAAKSAVATKSTTAAKQTSKSAQKTTAAKTAAKSTSAAKKTTK